MSLPDEAVARAELAKQLGPLFEQAERVHNAAVEILTKGGLKVTKPEGLNPGVVVLVASLLTKALKTFRAIQIACEAGLGQDAAVLARQLFETAIGVAFILQKDSMTRAAMFAAHEDQRRLVMVEDIDRLSSDGVTQELVKNAKAKVLAWHDVIGQTAVDSVRRHWSGAGLEATTRELGFLQAYAYMYRYTSAFAHGSDATVHFYVKKGDDVPTFKLSPGDDQVVPVLRSSMTLMHIIASAMNERLGMDEDDVVERIKAEMAAAHGLT